MSIAWNQKREAYEYTRPEGPPSAIAERTDIDFKLALLNELSIISRALWAVSEKDKEL